MSQISGVLLQIPNESLNYKALSGNAEILYTQLRQRALQTFPVNWAHFRVWDAYGTNLPSTAATDDLALITGTFGTNPARITAGDCKALGATTRRAGCFIIVPDHYDDGETIQLRIRCAMETTVASSSCTIDAECYIGAGNNTVSADLVTTAAQSMNSLSVADYDFTLNASLVNPGDIIDVRISIACNDAATGTVVQPAIYRVQLLCDTRG
jgi:hypothetical protein